jgi:hypothetical protein
MPSGVYLAGLVMFRAIRRYDRDIFKIVRLLSRLKRDRIAKPADEALRRLQPLTTAVYWLSPWMWGHQCLYRSLIYFFYHDEDSIINIGLTVRHDAAKLGHCWISRNGDVIDRRDRTFAAYYAQPFSHRRNVCYWLPAAANGIQPPTGIFLPKLAPAGEKGVRNVPHDGHAGRRGLQGEDERL